LLIIVAYDFCPAQKQPAKGMSKWFIGVGTCISVLVTMQNPWSVAALCVQAERYLVILQVIPGVQGNL